jgi:signal transduction histidine kinase
MNHHGEIHIQSETSKGTIVTIRLPIHSTQIQRRDNNDENP